MQTVGVAGLVLPVSRPHGGDVGEDDGGGFEDARLRRREAGRRLVRVVNQAGGRLIVVELIALMDAPNT